MSITQIHETDTSVCIGGFVRVHKLLSTRFKNCYAEHLSHRFRWTAKPWITKHTAANVQIHPEPPNQPLHWRRPRRIFVNSMSDLFHDQVPTAFLDAVLACMVLTPQLTKRPARLSAYVTNRATAECLTELAMRHDFGDNSLAVRQLTPTIFRRPRRRPAAGR